MRRSLAVAVAEGERRLFDRIGDFLDMHRLDPDPVNYGFAYRVLIDGDGPLARAVAALTDGGIRLTRRDIESLGNQVQAPHPVAGQEARREHDRLMARAQLQVEGFASTIAAMRDETQDFGRDLAASAGALNDPHQIVDVVQLTGAMIARVRAAETRLDAATDEASRLRSELEGARIDARRDPLTDLPNRRAFEEAFAAAAGTGRPLCLAICDIDRFKAVNDGFGHAVGDRVLCAVGALLVETCDGATVARHGGEEFAILFTSTGLDRAREILEGARARVAAKHYRVRGSDAPLGRVTFSGGLVAVAPGESLEAAFVRVDSLLYAAKEAGRNCVHVEHRK